MKSAIEKFQTIELYGALAVDVLVLIIAYAIGYNLRFGVDITNSTPNSILYLGIVLIFICIWYNFMLGGYGRIGRRGLLVEASQSGRYTLILIAGTALFLYVTKTGGMFSRLFIAYFAIVHFILDIVGRQLFKMYLAKVYKESSASEKFIVITTYNRILSLYEHIKADMAWSYEIVGVCLIDKTIEEVKTMEMDMISAGIVKSSEELPSTLFPILADTGDILETIRLSAVDSVLMLCGSESQQRLSRLAESILLMGVNVSISMDILPNNSARLETGKFAKFPVIRYNMSTISYRQAAVKRIMDIGVGLVGSIITLIMTPFVALAIKIDSPGPVFFKQERIGKNGRRFKIIKFRSMYQDAEARKAALMAQNEMDGLMFKMENDPRVTKVGDFIRRTSIDEFPQFWSVLIGDMTLIGTRPPTVDEFEKYNDYYRRRVSMKPGLTGLWQVSGRSDITDFDEVVRLDLEYIDNWSLLGDIKIIFQTAYVVLFGRGAK